MKKLAWLLRWFINKRNPEAALTRLRRQIGGHPRKVPGTVEILGWTIGYMDNLTLLSSLELLVQKGYNDFQTETIQPVIFDCGANIGVSILNYKRKYPTAKITAFEPDPTFLAVLRKNLHINQIKDVTIVPAAIWVRSGEFDFHLEGADGSRLVHKTTKDTIKVKTIDLSQYLRSRIDLLKIDIEGAELDVIPHLKGKLDLVQNLIVECHINGDQFAKFAELLETLADSGFRISINSMGKWRDLVRKPTRLPGEFDQYFLICAARNSKN